MHSIACYTFIPLQLNLNHFLYIFNYHGIKGMPYLRYNSVKKRKIKISFFFAETCSSRIFFINHSLRLSGLKSFCFLEVMQPKADILPQLTCPTSFRKNAYSYKHSSRVFETDRFLHDIVFSFYSLCCIFSIHVLAIQKKI